MSSGEPKISLAPNTPGAIPTLAPNDPSIVAAVEAGECRHCLGQGGEVVVCSSCGRGRCCGCSPYCATRLLADA